MHSCKQGALHNYVGIIEFAPIWAQKLSRVRGEGMVRGECTPHEADKNNLSLQQLEKILPT